MPLATRSKNSFRPAHDFEALVRRGYVTWAVVAANGVLFLLTLAVARRLSGFDSATLLNLGALSARRVAEGEWWRLLTGLFLHGSALHLGFNMLALFQAGLIVERLYAHAVFASIYLLSGIAGGCASVFWRQDVVSLGASGAVFGVYGALLAYLVLQRGSVPRATLRHLSVGAVFFVAYSLAHGFGQNNIDNAAHVGGLIAGLFIGMGTARPLHSTWSARAVARAATAGLVVLATGLALLWLVPDPQRDYQRALELNRALKDLAQADDEADRRMAGLRMRIRQGESSAAQAMVFMERELLPLWDAQLARLRELHQPHAEQEALRAKLIRYAELRRAATRELMEAIRDDDPRKAHDARRKHDEAQQIILELLRQAKSTENP